MNKGNIRFTAGSLQLGQLIILSQDQRGIIEFFGGSDKGFPFEDNFIFSLEMKRKMQDYSLDQENIESYISSLLKFEPSERQMIFLALNKIGILVKKMHMIHYQKPSGLDQFFYHIVEAEYILPNGERTSLQDIEELVFIEKLGRLNVDKIKKPHYIFRLGDNIDCVRFTHRPSLQKILKNIEISRL